MGSTGERINRRCMAEHRPATLPVPIRCTKGQGHDGPHVGTHSIVLNYEWQPAQSAAWSEADNERASDEGKS